MYAIRVDGTANLRTNASLRAYARLEYPNEDPAWVLASVRPRRNTGRARRFGLFGNSTPRPDVEEVPRPNPGDETAPA